MRVAPRCLGAARRHAYRRSLAIALAGPAVAGCTDLAAPHDAARRAPVYAVASLGARPLTPRGAPAAPPIDPAPADTIADGSAGGPESGPEAGPGAEPDSAPGVPSTPVPESPPDAAPVPVPGPVPAPETAPSVEAALAWAGSVAGVVGRFGCLADGAASGQWLVRFAGYGCASVGAAGDLTVVALQPAIAGTAGDTHAGLVLGPQASSQGTPIDVNARIFTSHQLRTGTAPNPWEVGWLVWHYVDDDHFYYFIPKPNGWELGKRDPAYPGGQRFLATGGAPRFPVGEWHDVTVTQSGATITVRANGRELVTFTDREAAYVRGKVGVYSEDAAVVARVGAM